MIQTAQEYFELNYWRNDKFSVPDTMIEFTKLHVEEALKQASRKAKVEDEAYHDVCIDKESILNAYTLENIK